MFFSKFFKTKKPETLKTAVLPNLPALNAWAIFFQGCGLTIYSRNAAAVPGAYDSDCIYLKSYPEVFELERKMHAEWFTTTSTSIYLQQWDGNAQSWSLVRITFLDIKISTIKNGIKNTGWASGYENGKSVIVIKGEASIVLE